MRHYEPTQSLGRALNAKSTKKYGEIGNLLPLINKQSHEKYKKDRNSRFEWAQQELHELFSQSFH